MSFIAQLRECGLGTEPASGHLYLLAEASAHPGLIGHLEFQGASHLCLWHLEPGSGLEKHAPWLFQLTPDSALDTWLGSAHGGLGCTVIETDAAIAALGRHLRRFSKIQQGKKRYFLRLGDPGSLSFYVASLARQPSALAQLFDHGRLRTLYFHDPKTELAMAAQPLFEQAADTCEQMGCLAWRFPRAKDTP
ncbi:DUF4123 domain-containing protein [Pseudomonas wayambapalatensis]|uniref:DUF4123 domain-containing protein n=1 Tax=Pseudomonas wayambapalatensis TaxID=485895 RepID=UPI003CE77D0F